MKTINRIIISGGGTGGHIFPAIAIANEVKRRNPNCEILFIGAEGKMEMEKVPEAGYKIVGLPIQGLQRRLTLKNIILPFKLLISFTKALSIVKRKKPQVVIGVGGYASAPTMYAASFHKVPILIQEQNGFPGKTNKTMAHKASTFCTAYDGLDKYFGKEKVVLTGNPVRKEMVQIEGKREKAIQYFGLKSNKKTILIIGGSLGAGTLNRTIVNNVDKIKAAGVQVIWQCGKTSYEQMQKAYQKMQVEDIHLHQFIKNMDLAYAAADIIISRAGAIAISELCMVGKPSILVPSPNVAEDHQTKNALALVQKNAAILIKDNEAGEKLWDTIIKLVRDDTHQKELSQNISMLGKPNATEAIVDEIEKLVKA